MNEQELSALAGIVLSLAFSYIPGLKDKFGALLPEYKRLIMLGLLAIVAAGAYGLACTGIGADIGLSVTCDKPGLIRLIWAFIAAVVGNQAAYMITPIKNAKRA